MTNPRNLPDEWNPCPPGTLSTLAGKERQRHRRQFLVRAGSAVGVLALGSGVGWLAFRGWGDTSEPNYGGIACSEVQKLAPQFMMAQLDESVTERIQLHLEQCAECRKLLESMPMKTAATTVHRRSSQACQCHRCRRSTVAEGMASSTTQPPMPLT
jgi:hypothetical protein